MRRITSVLIVVIFFIVGWLFGSGRISFRNLISENKSLPSSLDFSTVNQVYQLLKNDYDGNLEVNQLTDGLNNGLTQATGDPYTEYFNRAQAKLFNDQLDGTFSGVGAELGESNNNLIIIAPVANTPAAKAGLESKDIITAINGKSTTGLSIDQAVTEIRGPVGTHVTLSIDRDGNHFNVTITRAQITVPSVNEQILPGNVGYLNITQFSNDTSSLAQDAANKFKQASVKGVILDLRNDPGGLVDAAVNVSSLWLPQGQLIMQEKRGSQVIQTYTANGNYILHGIPTVVLINSGSASASEITAGALHDNKAAYIIGLKSFGKGSVQEVDNLSNGGELKVTIAHWYRPNGQNINGVGIVPDQTVNQSTNSGTDDQEQAAINYINSHH